MKTIVQEYGPIYGEPINGTVMGRPNGSVYVPPVNTASLFFDEDTTYLRYHPSHPDWLCVCDSTGSMTVGPENVLSATAESQDLSSYLRWEVYSDAELSTLIAYRDWTAGIFNEWMGNVYNAVANAFGNGDPLYCRVQLMNNGTPVANSLVLTATGWVEE